MARAARLGPHAALIGFASRNPTRLRYKGVDAGAVTTVHARVRTSRRRVRQSGPIGRSVLRCESQQVAAADFDLPADSAINGSFYSVWDLTIRDGNVMYSEVPPEESGDSTGGLMLSTTSHPDPIQITDNGGSPSIDGDRIAWSAVDDLVVGTPAVGQAVFTATFDDLMPVRLSHATADEAGGRFPAAGDGLVVWTEPGLMGDDLFAWDSQTGSTYDVVGKDSTLAHHYGTFLPSMGGG